MCYQTRKAAADFCETVFDQLMVACGLQTSRLDHALRDAFTDVYGAEGERMLASDDFKNDPEVRRVRYAPDFEVLDANGRADWANRFFVEAKYMAAPRFLPGARRFNGEEVDVTRVGSIEKHALDTYRTLYSEEGQRTAIFVICSYSKRPVLLEYVDRIAVLAEGEGERNARAAGSGTSHSNIDLDSMRSVEEFLLQEMGIELDQVEGWARLWPMVQMALFHVQAPEVLQPQHGETIGKVTQRISSYIRRPLSVVWQPSVGARGGARSIAASVR